MGEEAIAIRPTVYEVSANLSRSRLLMLARTLAVSMLLMFLNKLRQQAFLSKAIGRHGFLEALALFAFKQRTLEVGLDVVWPLSGFLNVDSAFGSHAS